MLPRHPRSTLTDTLFPNTTLCRSSTSTHSDVPRCSPTLACRSGGAMVAIFHPLDCWFGARSRPLLPHCTRAKGFGYGAVASAFGGFGARSEEHTSELQSLMRISYAVFCLKKKLLKLIYLLIIILCYSINSALINN